MINLKLEFKNLGKPECKDIKINPKEAFHDIPQAWEKDGNWYYNWLGAMTEAKFLGKKIPNNKEWKWLIENKIKECLKLPRLGKYCFLSNTATNQFGSGLYMTSQNFGKDLGGWEDLVVVFKDKVVFGNYNLRLHGYSVRCLN